LRYRFLNLLGLRPIPLSFDASLSLADKLDGNKKLLEESYAKLAACLTEIQLEDLEKVDSSNPKMQEFLGRINAFLSHLNPLNFLQQLLG